jgi:hypothetical protein
MGEPRIIGVRGDSRSVMARASDARPFRPYVYRGTGEDIYGGTVGYLQDVRRRAVARHEESMPDMMPGPEWYRELAEETGASPDPAPAASAPPAPVPAPAPARAPSAWLALDGDELAELAAACERNQAALAVTPASRCRRCGYLTTAVGHKVACDA